jgi:hypothetical protein
MTGMRRTGTDELDSSLIALSELLSTIDQSELTRSLLAIPGLATALHDGYGEWIARRLDRLGSAIWSALADSIEKYADATTAAQILHRLDLDRAEHAVFVARHSHLFTSHENQVDDLIVRLIQAIEDLGGYVGDPAADRSLTLQPGYRGGRDQREHDRDRMISALVGPAVADGKQQVEQIVTRRRERDVLGQWHGRRIGDEGGKLRHDEAPFEPNLREDLVSTELYPYPTRQPGIVTHRYHRS